MDYFSKFLRTNNQASSSSVKTPVDYAQEFHKSWIYIENILRRPDERQLSKGIKSTDVPTQLQSMVDALVWESTRTEAGGTGACLEYLLKNDVLDTLVRLSENDRPSGIQVEVLRTVQNMVILLDEQFLVHSAVHRAVLRLLRNCVGDDMQEQLDNRNRIMGAARNAVRSRPSEYEDDLVHLLCVLCSRIWTFRDLLIIFFHDKHWHRSDPLFFMEENEEDEEDEENIDQKGSAIAASLDTASTSGSVTPTSSTIPPPVPLTTTKPEYEFLLFDYLLRFVHREGQIGDFARAGLLFITDIAMSPGEQSHRMAGDEILAATIANSSTTQSSTDPISDAALALAEYILDGDFPDVLAAGLSAIYSLLPRKLEFPPQFRVESESGMVLGRCHESQEGKGLRGASYQKTLALGVEEANTVDFRSRLDHLLKLLEFIQDILRRNIMQQVTDATLSTSGAIVQSILDAIRRVFLENVLYPSILECSDTDGSAVAVMSYVETIVRMMPDGQINNLFAAFLVSEDNDGARSKQRPNIITMRLEKSKRRKSSAMLLLEMEAPESRKKSEYFTSMGRFTLKDLILANLKSQSQPAATCALQLLQTMLFRHPHLSIEKILLVTPDPNATTFPLPPMVSEDRQTVDDEDEWETSQFSPSTTREPLSRQPDTTLTTHEREMELYLTLVSRVDRSHDGDAFSTEYGHYLRDSILGITSQPAFCLTGSNETDNKSRLSIKHRLSAGDPILILLLNWLRTFFSNTPEFNLALTGALAILAMHPDRSMAGWLTFGTSDVSPFQDFRPEGSSSPEYKGHFASSVEEKLCNDEVFLPAARMDENTRPIIHTIFHGLVTQLDKYRQMVDDFDKYLLERRQGLLFSESLTDALNLALDIGGEPVRATPPIKISSTSKSKSAIRSSSSLVSFISSRKSKITKPLNDDEDNTRRKQAETHDLTTSPFGGHYQITGSISLESFVAPTPSSGPWASRKAVKWGVEEEDVFNNSTWSDHSEDFATVSSSDSRHEKDTPERTVTVTLSQLLDNVVIFEESVKELVSIIHARRSLGIDAVRYL